MAIAIEIGEDLPWTRHPHGGKEPSLWAGSTVSVAQLKCRNKI